MEITLAARRGKEDFNAATFDEEHTTAFSASSLTRERHDMVLHGLVTFRCPYKGRRKFCASRIWNNPSRLLVDELSNEV